MLSCELCKDVGFRWGGLLASPSLVRCKCAGGRERVWLDERLDRQGVVKQTPLRNLPEEDPFRRGVKL